MAKSDKKTKEVEVIEVRQEGGQDSQGEGDFESVPARPGGVSRRSRPSRVCCFNTAAGVRYAGRTDLMLVDIAPGSTLAGVFTRSATRSAAVLDCEAKLANLSEKPRHGFAILVNSGNANTFTGARGVRDVDVIAAATAQAVGVPPEHVFTSSTGVIGEPLDASKITDVLHDLVSGLHADDFEHRRAPS
jgi:glutamate N-acetyltransferase/amino-acid N-acetyltransferase